jgi:hypothetical protein
MQCECKTELEEKLTERFKEIQPTGRDHKVELQGYGFGMLGDTLVIQGFMEAKASAGYTTKAGAEKWRTVRQNMMFSYCPFCGKKATTSEGEDHEVRTRT